MKTVKQIAEAYNVSKQTIHRIIHKNGLVTIADGNRVLIPDDSEKAIIEALEALQGECGRSRMNADETRTAADVPEHSRTIQADDQSEELRENNCRLTEQNNELAAENRELSAQVELLKSQLEKLRIEKSALTAQLDTLKDSNTLFRSQLEDMKADKDFLKAQFENLLERHKDLTTALNAAQVLHGIDKQQKVIEVTPEEKNAGSGQQDPVRRTEHHHKKTGRQQQPSMMQKLIQGLKNRLT